MSKPTREKSLRRPEPPARFRAPAALALGGVLAAGLWSGRALWERLERERDRVVELCVDGRELLTLADQAPGGPAGVLSSLTGLGVSGVALYWDGRVPLEEAWSPWAAAWPPGLSVTLRPEAVPFHPFPRPPAALPFPAGRLLFAGPCPSDAPAVWARAQPWDAPLPDAGGPPAQRALAGVVPERVLRAHAISEGEMEVFDPSRAVARFQRAAAERGARFLYVRLFPRLSWEDNLAYLRALAEGLRGGGFALGPAAPRGREAGALRAGEIRARLVLAWGLAAGLPVLILAALRRRRPGLLTPLWIAALHLAAGLAVAAVLSPPEFALGLHSFRGVKAALGLPLVAAFFLLYRPEEIRAGLSRPVSWGGLAMAGALALAALVYLARSGHGSPLGVFPGETRLREALEALLVARPRFKEFLIGHPLLWLAFHLKRRRVPHPWPWLRDDRPWLLLGMVGPLSLVNTFCHAHAPLGLSLLRAVHGIWIGALLGLLAVGACRLAARR